MKPEKNPHLAWDGSTKHTLMDAVMNKETSTVDMAESKDFYKLRISYPDAVILLARADVKACFRFPRMHPYLTGTFGFLTDGFYCLAMAMVLGSNTSATSCEPFRQAIEVLTDVSANRKVLVQKHRHIR